MRRKAEEVEVRDRFDALLRSGVARAVGFVLGLVALGFLVAALARADGAWQTIKSFGLLGGTLTLVGWLCLEVGAILMLRSIGSPAAAQVWASAQLIKYLPIPGSAALGMVGSAVQHGADVSKAFSVMVRHAVVLIGGAVVVGAFATGRLTTHLWEWNTWYGALALLGSGAVSIWFASPPRRATSRISLILISPLTWFIAGSLLGLGLSSGSLESSALIASAVAAGWVAGQIVVPVPAGIGVREWATFVLLEPALGTQEAAAIALVSRVLHVLADAIVVAVFVPPSTFRIRLGVFGSALSDDRKGLRRPPSEDGSDM